MSRLPSLGPRGEGWFVIQVVLLALILVAGIFGGGLSGPLSWIPTIVGAVLLVAGLALALRGVRDLGAALTPLPRPRAGASLVDTGIYARVRHPIYGGLILASFGWAMVMASPSAVVLATVLLLFFELKAMREEAWLVAHDERYAEYRRGTRRFVPWVL